MSAAIVKIIKVKTVSGQIFFKVFLSNNWWHVDVNYVQTP